MKILVAEDDPVALETLTGLLVNGGHEVIAAHDGQEAERLLLAADAPAVAILDWMMPKQSGLDVCRSLRARGTGSPYVILITANQNKGDIETAFQAGVDDFLSKPVDPPELRARLKAAERIVTLQAQLQERVHTAEQRYRLLYASMNEGMALHRLICDEAGQPVDYSILEVNPAFERVTGIDRQVAVGRTASEVYGVRPAPFLAIYARVVATGQPESFETYFAPLNRHFQISAFRPETGQFATVFTDITERKQADTALDYSQRLEQTVLALKSAQARLRDEIRRRKVAERLKDDFTAVVSHELRTPLAIAKEGISLLADGTLGPLPERQAKTVSSVHQNMERLSRLIGDLLDFSRISTEGILQRHERVDLTEVVRKAVTSIEPAAVQKGLSIENVMPTPCFVDDGDPVLLLRAVSALLDNAVKFTEKGALTVSVATEKMEVRCQIADTGKGIRRRDLPHVFEKFTQFGRTDGPGAKGLGLGLAIARDIIEMHEGRAWAKSQPGQGSTFGFTLPAALQQPVGLSPDGTTT